MSLRPRLHIAIFLGLAAFVWGIVLLIQGTSIAREHLAPFSTVVGFLVVLGIAFEHVLWHVSWLQGWFVKRPDLRGTWSLELESNSIDPDTKERLMIVGYMGVKQTLSTLQMHLMTPESESWLVADSIRPSPSGSGFQVVGVYTNKPHMHLRGDKSEMHRGALVLDTHGPATRPDTLTGEYWTDRKTKGRISFSARVSQLCTRYEDAKSALSH